MMSDEQIERQKKVNLYLSRKYIEYIVRELLWGGEPPYLKEDLLLRSSPLAMSCYTKGRFIAHRST